MNGNFGFIHEKIEIKILILFIMRRLRAPIRFDALTALAMCDDGISYFDFAECVFDLVRTEHLLCEEGMYSLTPKGGRNGEITENSIPFSVRKIAEKNTSAFSSAQARDTMISTSHEVNPECGCTVSLSFSDGLGTILAVELFAESEKQAVNLEKGFRSKAERIYHDLIGLILEN